MYIQDKVICQKQVAVLLATYNGEKYLAEQIDSLLRQTYTDFCVYIHDDGSKDETQALLQRYEQQYPNKIFILDYPPVGGACMNFFSMIGHVEAPYYAFCDQDDVWHKDKIALCMTAMTEAVRGNAGKPYVIHSDLRIVDENGAVVHDSFWKACRMHPEIYHNLSQRVSSIIPGCTMLINHRVKEIMGNTSHALMHDFWLTVRTLAEDGAVITIPAALIDYRQHGKNELGAESCYKTMTMMDKLHKIPSLFSAHIDTYCMLHKAGYGSVFVYILNKVRERILNKRLDKKKHWR